MGKTIRGISINQLFAWKNANLGFTILGLFYLLFPWLALGTFNNVTAMFGMMFLCIGIIRAKGSVSVLGGLFAAFLGISYFFGTIALMDIAQLWLMAIVFFVLFLIMELGFVKIGPRTTSAKTFAIVPLALLTFSLVLAFIGQNPMLTIDWTNLWVSLNYLSILMFAFLSMIELVGWHIAGANTNKLILLFAIAAIATAFMGIYQGSLWQWT